ncbi:calmodulin-binding transcription activator 4-like [Zingiber officinale]|uniref:calmodulin-binding transcription activator 4-like n=1 Tax=Zingiber officinale TaxID=94328 RepID=UPI001C4CB0BC|nr:calmodulin-binding transcription activator 4-like [Zingiber officinale]
MQHGFDINVLRQEAQKRWLKASEVHFILKNYERFPLSPEPPHLPLSGSLFLFNRKVLRFFRKDGHAWRRKKDGRTIGEAHERLKVGNVDALSCYYAHGEQNPYFQRRSYWMLDPEYEHIVLVHYREVDEGRYVSGSTSNFSIESYSNLNHTSTIINTDRGYMSGTTALYEPSQSSYSQGSTEEINSKFVLENFDANHHNKFERLENSDKNSQPEVNHLLRNLEAQLGLDDDDNSIYFKENLLEYSCENDDIQVLKDFPNGGTMVSFAHENLLIGSDRGHRVNEVGKQQNSATVQLPKISGDHESQQNQPLCSDSPSWTDVLQLSSKSAGMESHGRSSNFLACNGIPDSSISRDTLPTFSGRENMPIYSFGASENLSSCTAEEKPNGHEISESDLHHQLSATRRFLLGSKDSIESPSTISQLKMFGEHHSSAEGTFEANGRKENSSDWIETIPIALGNNANSADFSSIFYHSQFGASLATDLSSQRRRFSICEVSPEWAFSYESTKVIITGEFLCDPLESSWAVMFGDIEVPLEIAQEGVLRCWAPQHSTGKVDLCITSGNRKSCSEVREFEFRAKLTTSSYIDHLSVVGTAKDSEEILLLARLSQMLLDNSTIEKGPIDNQVGKSRKLKATDDHWKQIIEALKIDCDNSLDTKDWIMLELLKDKLLNWLSMKHQNNKQADCLLSKQEHGIIHLISGLGYEWALNLILEHGVGINFRDENGWTALHWAAYCGREKMVAALLAAGASAELVTDPTAQDPVGKTPGFLASARGHTGLAGYLSEVALTSHLSSLTIEESEISEGSSEVKAVKAVESISQRSVEKHGETEDELSLKDSLAAVRNAALAAARIQAAFRAHSFRKRLQKTALSLSCDDYGMTPGDIQALSAVSRLHRPSSSSQDQNSDRAALSIQKKYRGWKGRRDFLTLRQHVVKIQAHVRGHQVRKKYREILWTVGVVEKVILRWRRKGAGLRGFRAEPEITDEDDDDDDIAKIFRRQKVDGAIDEAVSRVLSMVDSPDARQQYRRMLERYHKAKAELSKSDEAPSGFEDGSELDLCLMTDADQTST